MKRVIWIVLDSVGIGELPDADRFGDVGSNTFCNTVKETGISLPNLRRLGIGNIDGVDCYPNSNEVIGSYGKCVELSNGKDTTVGHWEMAGVHSPNPLPTYPNGFPMDIMKEFENRTERKWLANKPASGTEILDELGEEHMKTGALIVYTSADSVFQIAAHEEIVPIDELYRYCEIARELLRGEHGVARVIARPFIGVPGSFKRTSNRRDFSLNPPGITVLDRAKASGLDVIGVGKIEDIFNGVGITHAVHTKDNMDGVDHTLAFMKEENHGILFTNLVEFDSTWGHRNDVKGYAGGLVAFDERLPEILETMRDEDILIINADHGCDPTTESTDHSREYIPVLIYGKSIRENINIGVRSTFADIGQSIASYLELEPIPEGTDFMKEVLR